MRSILFLAVLCITANAAPSPFRTLEPGLELAEFTVDAAAPVGDKRVRVVRVDPGRFELGLYMRSEHGGSSLTATQWADKHGLVAAINTSMFATDHKTSTFELRSTTHVNNPVQSTKAGHFLAFSSERVAMVDSECDDTVAAHKTFPNIVQGYRVVSCKGEVLWKDRGKIWSHAVIGTDRQGRLLLIHARTPWSTATFAHQIKALPIDLDRLMYAEGGPEATLLLRSGEERTVWVGSYETGFHESDANRREWALPNVLGVRRRAEGPR